MSNPTAPYPAFAHLIATTDPSVSPAELQGLLIGRSCAGAGFAPEPWLLDVTEWLGHPPEEPLSQALLGLQRMLEQELKSDEMALTLLLPNDDASVSERALALGQWCQGFVNGFGWLIGDRPLSKDALETVQDLTSIAQIGDQLDDSEESEIDYMEVMEYLRVAPLLLFTECAQAPQAPAPSPTLH